MARGPQRAEAILDATLSVAAESGYDGLTIDAVAARAHASKATVYRRWKNKAELVRAALDRLDDADNATIPDTGALRSDLLAVLAALAIKASPAYLALMQGLVAASRHDPELAAALADHVDDDERSPFRAALSRAIDRGELPAGCDTAMAHDVAEALVLRQLQVGGALDEAFALRVVDGALLPLLGVGR